MTGRYNLIQSGSVPGVPGSCLRCGTCCKKGGPCLHIDDLKSVQEDRIPIAALFTIRAGEPSWDNIRNRISDAEQDIIKIRSKAGERTCLFFNRIRNACDIYAFRPLECRVLKCWDIRGIIDIYDRRRLSRKDFLSDNKPVWELVVAHQAVCDYGKIDRAVKNNDMDMLAYLIRYDRAYRDLVVERGFLDARELDFFFGSPLSVTIRRYDIPVAEPDI